MNGADLTKKGLLVIGALEAIATGVFFVGFNFSGGNAMVAASALFT